ncbi:hypothetical protein D3C72_2120780 [compost metagenome]
MINESEKNEVLRNLLFLKSIEPRLLHFNYERAVESRDSELEQLIDVIAGSQFERAY